MALQIAALIGMGAIGGAFQGGLRNTAERRQAQRQLDNAVTQSQLYEQRIGQLWSAASVESGQIFARAAEVRGERMASLAARGISLDSGMVESVNYRERENVLNAVNTTVTNAWMEADTWRTQGRLQVSAARQMLNDIRARRSEDVALGFLSGGLGAASNVLSSSIASGGGGATRSRSSVTTGAGRTLPAANVPAPFTVA
jgi:hypothetical protein